MNNQQYLDTLRKALSRLDKSSRADIVRELQSYAAEAGDENALHQKFGDPKTLAQQYLEGVDLPSPLSARAGRVGRYALMGLGGVTAVLIAIALFFVLAYSGDEFDYANEQAGDLHDATRNWTALEWTRSVDIRVDQASVVFYWHDQQTIKWDCDGANNFKPSVDDALEIRHGHCIVYLPSTDTSMEISQGGVVLVRPQTSAHLKLHQANLRIAENGERYRYDFQLSRSEVESLTSLPDAKNIIAVVGHESSIERYEHR
ncbi:MAG: hypothetical protein AAF420_14305 [Pseudomonadota bacterium]